MRTRPLKILRQGAALTASVALLSAPAAPSQAWPFGGGGDNPMIAYCANERAPLVALNTQYDEIDHSRMSQSIQNGVFAAGSVIGSSLLGNLFGGGGGRATPDLSPTSVIFGSGRGDRRETATAAIVAGLTASVATYISLKGDTDDRKALARSIEQDAGGQIALGRTIADEGKALAVCRTRQVEDFKARQAAAPSDADRRKMKHEGDQILDAIKADIALTDKVVGHQASLAKTFTQARAMVDNRSEAQVLGAQKPAYADTASTTPLSLPPKSVTTTSSPAAPPPPEPPPEPEAVTLVATKATPVRATPSLKGKLVMTLAARHEVKALGQSATDGWWEIDVAGSSGFIRAATVTVKGAGAKPAAPKPEEPDNVREYNKVVLEARDEGPDRMRNLMTSFQ